MNPLIPGFILILVGALANGAFGFPLRIRKRYEMENTMMVGMFCATWLLPTIAAFIIFPGWWSAMEEAGFGVVAAVAAFGLGWGVGSITYGLGITYLGLSLGFALIMGLVTAIGSIVPMIRKWSLIPADARIITLIGIAVCVVGVAIIGRAGGLREQKGGQTSGYTSETKGKSVFLLGLFVCILSGLFSACANMGFDHSKPIGEAAARMNINPLWATLPQWLPIYWGGYLAIGLFMLARMIRNKSFDRFVGPGSGRDLILAVVLGTLHFTSMTQYGMATVYVGRLGTTVGFAVFMATSIIVANLLGFLTGEWRKAPRKATTMLYAGLTVLILAVVILAIGNGRASG